MSSGEVTPERLVARRVDEVVLARAVEPGGGRPSLIGPAGDVVTAPGVACRVAALRTALASRVAPGARVAVAGASPVTDVVAVIAVMGGGAAVPLTAGASVEEVERSLRSTRSAAVLSDVDVVCATAIRLGLDVVDPWPTTSRRGPGAPSDRTPPLADWGGSTIDDVGLVLRTSGTTARPRSVPVRHRAVASTTARASTMLSLGPDDRSLVLQPLHHVAGLVSGALLALRAGGSTVLARGFEPRRAVELLRRTSPTLLTGTPTMLLALARAYADAGGRPGSSGLRLVRAGGGPLDETIAREVEDSLGVPLLPAYGMSECLQITQTPPGERRPGAVGISIGPRIRVRSGDRVLPPGSVGAVEVEGPSVFDGYDDGDGGRFTTDGWFRTGDVGRLDADGWLSVLGRTDDVVVRGGENVSLLAVADALRGHPAVVDAIVAGVPHPVLGADVGALVVAAEGTSTGALRGHVEDVLGPTHVPAVVVPVDELPLGPTGKTDRRAATRLLLEAAEAAPIGVGGAPVGAEETAVAADVVDLLGRRDLGRDDDLLLVGATSLVVAALAARLTARSGRTVHVTEVVRHPTVRTLAAHLRARTAAQRPVPAAAPASGVAASSSTVGVVTAARRAVALRQVGEPPGDRPQGVSPVFVLSPPRSGSTLLRAMLAGHPGLFAPPELRLLRQPTMSAWAEAHAGPRLALRDGLVRAVMGAREVSAGRARRVVDGWIRRDVPTVEVLGELAAWVSPRRLVDKSPLTSLDPSALRRAEAVFDEPAYIHLARDPRAVATSFGRAGIDQTWPVPWDGPAAALGSAAWRAAHEHVLTFLDGVPVRRQTTVRLRRLTDAPTVVARELTAFLGLPFDDRASRAHDLPAERMTDGVVAGARMVGDPRFHDRDRIEPVDGDVPDRALDDAEARLMVRLGLPGPARASVHGEVLDRQRRLLRPWGDAEHSWLFAAATSGAPPLFWVLQSRAELAALRAALGPDDHVVALRSMHLLGRDPSVVDSLSTAYAAAIGRYDGAGPVLIGGNCQGGRLARVVADRLLEDGREVALLWTLDAELRRPYEHPLLLLFGDESDRHNPRLRRPDTRPLLAGLHPRLRIAEVPGGHGGYFAPDRLQSLLGRLRASTHAAIRG